MAGPFHTQLQPFEENQSPSPVDEIPNPYELNLVRSTSSGHASQSPPSPVNTLHRQLSHSDDPKSRPPAWQRRSSVTAPKSGRSINSGNTHPIPPRSHTEQYSQAPPSRRHPSLMMTTTRPGMPNQMFIHESSPSASSTSLVGDPTIALPQSPFRRRQGGTASNRSSIHSQDQSGMNSEEPWTMEQEPDVADMSNPLRQASERPLDTIRRLSNRMDYASFRGDLPGEIIWPTAPLFDAPYTPPTKSRSVTSMASLQRTRRSSRTPRASRQSSMDMRNDKMMDPKSTPASPIAPPRQDAVLIPSNNSSSTSLASHLVTNNKSSPALESRPPSAYYSRDLLGSLAPREGGYAIAAQMGGGLGAVGSMVVDERRKSQMYDTIGPKVSSRAPMSKSSGMGRWSLDGGEHYGSKSYSPSTHTTSTNSSGNRVCEGSPLIDDDSTPGSFLPEGASPPRLEMLSSPAAPAPTTVTSSSMSTPVNPSPLSRATTANHANEPVAPGLLPPTPIPIEATTATVPPPSDLPWPSTSKKSTKQLAEDAKAAEKEAKAKQKAEETKRERERLKAAREALMKRQAEKEAEKRKEKEVKRKEKEEKEKKKSESRTSMNGSIWKLRSPSTANLPFMKNSGASPPIHDARDAANEVPPVPRLVIPATAPLIDRSQDDGSEAPANGMPNVNGVPFPQSSSQSAHRAAPPDLDPPPPRQTHASMPPSLTPNIRASMQVKQGGAESKSRLGMLGTIKKRLSVFGGNKVESQPQPSQPAPAASIARKAVPSISAPGDATFKPLDKPASVPSPGETPRPQQVRAATPPPRSMAQDSPLSNLPPRKISYLNPPVSFPPQLDTTLPPPQTYPPTTMTMSNLSTPPVLRRSASHQTPPIANSASSQMARASSHGQPQSRDSGISPSSSFRRGSIRGPRPNPSRSPEKDRPSSVATTRSTDLPFAISTQSVKPLAPDIVTPSTSGESSVHSHNMSTSDRAVTDLASPFTSDGDENPTSRKSSLIVDNMVNGTDAPAREGSNDTIHPDVVQSVPLTVSAH